jgi:hypothetical protein
LIKNHEEVKNDLPKYLSGELKECLQWVVKKYRQTSDIFSKLYILDNLVLGNPKDGPVSKASTMLENMLRELPIYKSMAGNFTEQRVNGEVSSAIGDLLYGNEQTYNRRIQEIVEQPHSEKIFDLMDILKRMIELNESSNDIVKKKFQPTHNTLRWYVEFFYKRIAEKDLNLDDPEEIERGLQEIENFILK